jgi:DUF4097 and DUF4098 domain-containing protein YvlB
MKFPLLIVVVLALSLVCTAAEKKFEKSFNVSPGGTLLVSTDIGSIRVSGTSGNQVSVVAVMNGSQKDVEDFRIEAQQTDRGVEVRGKMKHSSWFGNINDLDITITVKVPSQYRAKLNTSGGDVDVTGLKGDVEGQTSGGNIDLADIEGSASMETSGGNIAIRHINGPLRVSTSGGEVRVEDVKGQVRATTSGGNMAFTGIDGRLAAETSGGDIRVELAATNKGVNVQTSGGDIEILLPGNAGAAIDASTSGGEVTCDLPITMQGKFDSDRLRGTLNGGGEMVRASTSGGNVHIGESH